MLFFIFHFSPVFVFVFVFVLFCFFCNFDLFVSFSFSSLICYCTVALHLFPVIPVIVLF